MTPLVGAPSAHARLFWKTYGSVVPAVCPDGSCGCTWNVNQDYFVPRHSDSTRYGLFSPCKHSHTRSPACKTAHPLYPGYCSIYGKCHYAWRNHVYRCHCGCCPIKPYRGIFHHKHHGGCSGGRCQVPYRWGCGPTGGVATKLETACCAPLANVESPGLVVLGTIPPDGAELLGTLANEQNQLRELGGDIPSMPTKGTLEKLGLPPLEELTAPLLSE